MTSCLGSRFALPPIQFKKTLRVDADFLNTEKNTSVFENTRLPVDGQIRFKNATCGRRLFLNTEKKSPFSKIPGYVWTRPLDLALVGVDCTHFCIFLGQKRVYRTKLYLTSLLRMILFSICFETCLSLRVLMKFSCLIHRNANMYMRIDFHQQREQQSGFEGMK